MSSPKKVASPIIGYVHKLSPLKQGKKTRWCDMELQMKDKRMRVVCFSKVKRDIFEAKQQTLTPVKISNYIVSKGLHDGNEEILVNDMTSVGLAAPSEYSFQYIPDEQPKIVPLNEVKENIDAGEKVAVKGRIVKGRNVERVGHRNLRMLKSTIFDGTSTLFLTLWENEIDSVSEGKVYILSNVNVKMNDMVKVLSTTQKTLITELEDDEMEVLDDSVAIQMLDESINETVVIVNAFKWVDVDKYRCCVHCSKKLPPGLETKVIKCTQCFRRMRLQDCELNVCCRVSVKVDDSDMELSIFADVLAVLFGTSNVTGLSEDDISEKLLDLEDVEVTVKDDIITTCKM